jgi:signal transduction histidine kinase
MKRLSIRLQLLLAFISYCLLFVLFLFLSFELLRKGDKIRQHRAKTDLLQNQINRLLVFDQDFLLYGLLDGAFYADTGRSLAAKRLVLSRVVDSINLDLSNDPEAVSFGIKEALFSLDSALISYQYAFLRLTEVYTARGFREYGTEGAMRRAAHTLEETLQPALQILLLQMRRHEKDYMLRKDEEYLKRFESRYKVLLEQLTTLGGAQSDANIALLRRYRTLFFKLVSFEEQIGLSPDDGIRMEVKTLSNEIHTTTQRIIDFTLAQESGLIANLRNLWIVSVIGFLLLSVLMAYYLAHSISRPIQRFAQDIRWSTPLEKTGRLEPLTIKAHSEELLLLEDAFNQLIVRLNNQFEDVQVGKKQLLEQNEELQLINQKLKESESSLADSNRVKDKFFSIIAHDLRGPIGNLSAFLQMLLAHLDSFSKEEIRQFAQDMLLSVESLGIMMANLLEWSRMQMNALEVHLRAFNPSKIMERNIQVLKGKADTKRISITALLGEGIHVVGDENMFDFVFRNLLSNAIKFSYEDTAIIVRSFHEGNEVVFEIEDRGIGMSPDELNKLFHTETHFTKRGTRDERGTGLGLILCKEFLQKMNGRIAVTSVPTKGSSFKFYLPASIDAPIPAAK